MTRTALARQYRPRRFGEIALQEHVSETLKTAVSRGRVAHAYLFCGPRGVGKTTAARVLAMALNCPDRTPDGEPCGQCESCERIWAGRTSLDVVEIDAASNRGVDDARDLRERAMYAPTEQDRYKVYIVDEAHMLTREAWNALLKVLEEPPPRVIFVFATTEPQKIQQAAPPILSRCQRFDFRRISTAGIVERLRQVLDREGIEVDEDALVPLARRAEGGMRDALSLLDQVLSFAGHRRVTGEDVRQVLGLVGEELFLELFAILAERRHADVFRFVERLVDEGYDLAEFYRALADALRTLLVVRLEGPEAAEIREDLREIYADRAARFGTGDLVRMLGQVAEFDTEGRFRKSANPRILLEALLLRFAHLDRTVELEELIRAAAGEDRPPSDGEARRSPSPRATPAPAVPIARSPAPVPVPSAPRASTGAASPSRAPAPQATGVMAAPAVHGASPAPAPAPTAGAEARPSAGARSAAAALQAMLQSGEGVPAGLGLFLKAGRVAEELVDRVVLEMPPGPGIERLSGEAVARRTLEEALSNRLGRAVMLEVRPIGAREGRIEPPQRITPQQIKADRLSRLTREEPLLDRIVSDWDLELLE